MSAGVNVIAVVGLELPGAEDMGLLYFVMDQTCELSPIRQFLAIPLDSLEKGKFRIDSVPCWDAVRYPR
jgi:hypothetical protein